jgi:hypothetical protein
MLEYIQDMKTQQVFKKQWYQNPVQRVKGSPNQYWVQSENPKHKQLWYRVIMDLDNDKVYCACDSWKFSKDKTLCKHMLKVLQLEGGQTFV